VPWLRSQPRILLTADTAIDFSAAEAFLRLQRLCSSRYVVLVLCGCGPNSPVGKALRAVDLWPGSVRSDSGHGGIESDKPSQLEEYDAGVEVFATLNDALEHCENAQLRALYARDLRPHRTISHAPPLHTSTAAAPIVDAPVRSEEDLRELAGSPRRTELYAAAQETVVPKADSPETTLPSNVAQPLPLLIQVRRLCERSVRVPLGRAHRLCIRMPKT
jgi:SulP family sulfate permease